MAPLTDQTGIAAPCGAQCTVHLQSLPSTATCTAPLRPPCRPPALPGMLLPQLLPLLLLQPAHLLAWWGPMTRSTSGTRRSSVWPSCAATHLRNASGRQPGGTVWVVARPAALLQTCCHHGCRDILRRSGRCHRSSTADGQQQQPGRAAAAAHPATTIFRSPMCCRLRLACRPSAEYSLSSAFSRMLPGGGGGGCSAAQMRTGKQHCSREPPLPATTAASSKRLPRS